MSTASSLLEADRAARHAFGVGASVTRNEDRRHLAGAGRFLADLRLAGMREAVFVRSQIAHGRIRGITSGDVPDGALWTAGDLASLVEPIVADSSHPDFRHSEYPVLATGKVRFVGELIAVVVAENRARAEDLATEVVVDIEELPAVTSIAAALDQNAPMVHDHWPDNRYLETFTSVGQTDAPTGAAITVSRKFRMARQAGVPLETRGVIAYYDRRLDQLVLYSSTQFPHVIRSALARCLHLQERQVRVIAPDVGGGFGIKTNLYPEEIALAAIAIGVDYPVRWIEDRYEHMVGSAHAREHEYEMTVHAAPDGELLGLEATVVVDAGAYSVWPWTAVMDAGMSAGILPGPYRIRNYRVRAVTVATNKTPLGPYRGVGRPGACFAIERMVDEVAHELGLEPKDVRAANMVRPEDFPYTSVTGKIYDSGDYPRSVHMAADLIGHEEVRRFQVGQAGTVRVGIGYASFTEQTAHGATEWASRGMPVVFGFESATVTMDPTAGLTIRAGIQSHGQGLETTLGQVACEVLGIEPSRITVLHGDTDISPYGMGTFAARSMVMAGGATYEACQLLAARLREIAAALVGGDAGDFEVSSGAVVGPAGTVTFAECAEAAYLHVERLPASIPPGLEFTSRYRPSVETGAFTYSTHAAVVAVDTETGQVSVRKFAVVEDCGTVVNPMIVDGQIRGGVVQGIGTALMEEFDYDDLGQPKATTFMDYMLPGASDVPEILIGHLDTPSPFTVLGMKGMGEGGAIAPPAAIANAVTDALRDYGVSIAETPITPKRVWLALQEAADRRSSGGSEDVLGVRS